MEKFKLFHLALYSKGWYKKFNPHQHSTRKTIFDDLSITMTADGYMGSYMSKSDIVRVMLKHCQLLDENRFKDMSLLVEGIAPHNCWEYGYYTKDNYSWVNKKQNERLPEYDYYTAVVYYCLSVLRFCGKEHFELPKPDYKNCLPRKNGIKENMILTMFN